MSSTGTLFHSQSSKHMFGRSTFFTTKAAPRHGSTLCLLNPLGERDQNERRATLLLPWLALSPLLSALFLYRPESTFSLFLLHLIKRCGRRSKISFDCYHDAPIKTDRTARTASLVWASHDLGPRPARTTDKGSSAIPVHVILLVSVPSYASLDVCTCAL